uniref:EamA domain-containing protein n=1 Tax=Alexandrium andersonii TaxID=327968 RepID=A0A7S2I3M4_9DINO
MKLQQCVGACLPYIVLVSVQLVFAGHSLLIHHELSGSVSVVAFAVYREVGATLCFVAAIRAFEPKEGWPQLQHSRLFLQAGGSMGGQLTLMLVALKATKPGLVTFIQPVMPVFVALLAWCYYRDRLTRVQMVGMLLCMAGTYVLASTTDGPGELDFGVLIAIMQTLVGANYLVMQKPLIRVGYSPLVVAGGSYAVALVLTATIGVANYIISRVEVVRIQWWGSSHLYPVVVMYAIILMSVYNYIAMAWVTKKAGPTVVALANLLQGLFANAAEAFLFGHQLGLAEVLGALVLSAGFVAFVLAMPRTEDEEERSFLTCQAVADASLSSTTLSDPVTIGSSE